MMDRRRVLSRASTALLLLSAASTAAAACPGLWCVDIDNGPAPSPADGPPFSANASRDRSLLPFQIVGIVASYIGSVLIVGSLLLTVGRRMRKRAQNVAAPSIEMSKPMKVAFDPSPISPAAAASKWYSPRSLRAKRSTASSFRSAGDSQPASPDNDSVAGFDNVVLEADRARRQEEMARLYAAVMAQDDANAPDAISETSTLPPAYSQSQPLRLITSNPTLEHLYPSNHASAGWMGPSDSKSPARAIYPLESHILPRSASPSSPTVAGHLRNASSSDARTDWARASPIGNGKSPTASPKKGRKSLRNIKISSPLQMQDRDTDERTPLTPRVYVDPGTPPEPPTARTLDSATTPGAAPSIYHPDDSADEQLDQVRALPLPYPQRMAPYQYDNPAQAVTNAASTRPDPTAAVAAGARSGTLPLREMNRRYASQQREQATSTFSSPLSPGGSNAAHRPAYATSAGPVKTTFLDAPRDRAFAGLRTAGLATPYSPYMPFTPLTPVTPHLTSRAERKQRLREERAVRGAVTEEDRVADDGELWSSGY